MFGALGRNQEMCFFFVLGTT